MRFGSVLGLLCFLWSIFCFAEVENTMVRRKRHVCEDGTYNHNNIECCHCPSGYYVRTHCTDSRTDRKCELCMQGFYRDHPSGEEQCEPCTVCEAGANMEAKKICTPYSNTVCGCMEGHYCDKGENCRACYACDKCEGLGVKVPCTDISNTVCHEKPAGSSRHHTANMEAKKICTQISNTVCGCMEGHYCDKDENCLACSTCDKCESLGVKVPCTDTNNTACLKKSAGSSRHHTGFIAAVLVSSILITAGVCVLFLRRRRSVRGRR